MLKRFAVVLAAGMIAASARSSAQEADSEALDLLRATAKTYAGLKTFRIDFQFVTELLGEENEGQKAETSVTIAAQEDGKVRVEQMNAMSALTALTDGEHLWIHIPPLNEYKKLPLDVMEDPDNQDVNPRAVAAGYVERFVELPDLIGTAKILRTELFLIGKDEEHAEETDAAVVEYTIAEGALPEGMDDGRPKTLWIDTERNVVLQEQIKETVPFQGQAFETIRTMRLTDLSLNEPLDPALFVFEIPDGAKEVALFTGEQEQEPEAPDLTGQAAPDFALNDLNGTEVRLTDLRGKVVLVDFWATWCGPCRFTHPIVEKLHQEFKDKGLVILTINNEPRAAAKKYLTDNHYTFTVLSDPENAAHEDYQIMFIPTMYFIDREGMIVKQIIGFTDAESAEQAMRDALKTAGL